MKDPQLDELHALVAERGYGGLPNDREDDLREVLAERYAPFIEKMAQAHLFSYNLYISDPDGVPYEYVELDASGAYDGGCEDEQHIVICGHDVVGGGWLHEEAQQPDGRLLHKVIASESEARKSLELA
jgi:hypothetical protein